MAMFFPSTPHSSPTSRKTLFEASEEMSISVAGRGRVPDATITEEVVVDETGEVFEIEESARDALLAYDRRIEACKRVRKCL